MTRKDGLLRQVADQVWYPGNRHMVVIMGLCVALTTSLMAHEGVYGVERSQVATVTVGCAGEAEPVVVDNAFEKDQQRGRLLIECVGSDGQPGDLRFFVPPDGPHDEVADWNEDASRVNIQVTHRNSWRGAVDQNPTIFVDTRPEFAGIIVGVDDITSALQTRVSPSS